MDLKEARKRTGKRLIGHTNGDAMASMHKLGMQYTANRGVSLQELKEIASEFEKNHELAQWLWNRGDFREMRILAFMLEEPDKVTPAQAYCRAAELSTMELAVQASINLFAYLPFIHNEMSNWLNDENYMVRGTAFVTLSQLAQNSKDLADSYFREFMQQAADNASTENIFLKKAVSRFLRALACRNAEFREVVHNTSEQLQQQGYPGAAYIAEEVQYEIKYLEENNL